MDKNSSLACSMQEAARLLGVSRAKIYQLADSDPSFPAFRCGGRRLVNVAALQRWLDEQTGEARHGQP